MGIPAVALEAQARLASLSLRMSLLVLVAAVATEGQAPAAVAGWLLTLTVIGGAQEFRAGNKAVRTLGPIAEGLVVAAGVISTGGATSPLLLYLLVPGVVAGLGSGVLLVGVVSGAVSTLLVLGALEPMPSGPYLVTVGCWVVLGAGAGLVAAWARGALDRLAAEPVHVYANAHRLLDELRQVVRRLPVALDPGSTAQAVLQKLRATVPFVTGAVYARTDEGRLICLAVVGPDRESWAVDEDPAVAQALKSGRSVVTATLSGLRGGCGALVLPMMVGIRPTGIVVLASVAEQWTETAVAAAGAEAGDAAVRLETALLFDEVRGIAISEERHRLASEIHDGIAQDLAFLGYGLDELAATDNAADRETALTRLRAEVSRTVGDLRMSLYDLKSEVDQAGGLAESLSEHVRTVGLRSGLRVHLSLSDSGQRLLPEMEAGLLRIAQEAVTNARKHSRGTDLWVTCDLAAPSARISVLDNGVGRAAGAPAEGIGLRIMSERAAALGAALRTGPGPDGVGTEVVVEVQATRPLAAADRVLPESVPLKSTPRRSDDVPSAAGR